MRITVGDRAVDFPQGTVWKDVAERFQGEYPREILLAKVGPRLYELHKRCPERDMEAEFITAGDKIGNMTYRRSAILMMLKAFFNVCEGVEGFDVIVEYSIGGGIYCHLKGDLSVTPELLDTVKETMRGYSERKLPIMKHSVPTDEAIRFFRRVGMHSKEHLFRYRMTSRVNLYSLGNFEDYFYGFMVMDCSYIRLFDLLPYNGGFVLLLPTETCPDALPPFRPMEKLFSVQKSSTDWAEKVGIANIGMLNDMIVQGETDHLILMQEAIFEKTVGDIAAEISAQDRKAVLIAGPSSSGKTSFSKRLAIQLQALGKKPHPISVDNYFINRALAPRDENGSYDFESIGSVDLPTFNRDMAALLRGESVELPRYNFFTGEREYKGDFRKLSRDDILVIEGIHCLNPLMSESLPEEAKFRVYISALTQLNIDEHNRIPSTDARLIRRMVRDNRTRGYSAEDTISMWKNVRRGEERNIFPFQERADVMVNSAMLYELPVLKIFAEPILFQIKETSPSWQEAKRLLKFLDYMLPISPEFIPQNSIVREFIGGSCLDVG